MTEDLQQLLAAAREAQAPEGVKTRIIAIDGQGGAGKTTLAAWLARELPATAVIHTDDFASWHNPINWWPELIVQALEPLANGLAAHYQPTVWAGAEREPITIEPGGTVLLEGVTATRNAFVHTSRTPFGWKRTGLCASNEDLNATAKTRGHSGSGGWTPKTTTSHASNRLRTSI